MSVYFIQVGTDGPVKIGQSDDPLARLAQLQTSHYEPLRLVGLIPNGSERALHEKYEKDRLNGEWFTASDELLAEVTVPAEAFETLVNEFVTIQRVIAAVEREARRGDVDYALSGLVVHAATVIAVLGRAGVEHGEHPVVARACEIVRGLCERVAAESLIEERVA